MTPLPPDALDTLVAADRWRLWSSLLRGLSHQLANVAQMLALDPAPEIALVETRERVAETMAALNALRRPTGSAPVLLAPVLADVDRLQALQMEFPAAPLAIEVGAGVPALAVRPDDLAHVLLACVTAAKRAGGESRVELRLEAVEDGEGARLTLAASPVGAAAEPGEAALALLERMGGRRVAGGAFALWLPAWRRPGFVA